MLGRSEHILRKAAHSAIAELFEQLLQERGVNLQPGDAVVDAHINAGDDGQERIEVAFESDEAAQPYDAVILAQGVKPNIAFANTGELACGQGLLVDDYMRTSDPCIYAAGDVAQALDLATGSKRIAGLWADAVVQGRIAGAAMAHAANATTLPRDFASTINPHVRAYPGSIACNTIHVQDIVFASAGTLTPTSDMRIDVDINPSGVSEALAFDTSTGCDKLIGFNVLATTRAENADVFLPGRERKPFAIIGAYRQQVIDSLRALREERGDIS